MPHFTQACACIGAVWLHPNNETDETPFLLPHTHKHMPSLSAIFYILFFLLSIPLQMVYIYVCRHIIYVSMLEYDARHHNSCVYTRFVYPYQHLFTWALLQIDFFFFVSFSTYFFWQTCTFPIQITIMFYFWSFRSSDSFIHMSQFRSLQLEAKAKSRVVLNKYYECVVCMAIYVRNTFE